MDAVCTLAGIGPAEGATGVYESAPLADVLMRLDEIDVDDCEGVPTIFAAWPLTASSMALISAAEPVAGRAPNSPGLHYVLEVALARDALARWSLAHKGVEPIPTEAVAAVVDYATFGDCFPSERGSWTSRCLQSH